MFLAALASGLTFFAASAQTADTEGHDAEGAGVQPRRADAAASVRLMKEADSLRLEYRFQDALEKYGSALGMFSDTTLALTASDSLLMDMLETRRVMAENGLAMKEYVSEPVVVARHRFSVEDFYLYYPMQDRSWRPVPNQLDSVPGHPFVNATYVPDGAEEIYFSAVDAGGARNVCYTHFADSLWSAPVLVDENMTSSGDEIFPVMSADGRTLYFASSGLYGAGGYDLYKTDWDPVTSTWGVPENLGFPYSSPYDDLLYYNTPDGKYTLFASNRACSKDSVVVYVLDYDSMPVRKPVESPEELKEIAALVPVNDPSKMDTGSSVADEVQDNVDISRYKAKMSEIYALQDSIQVYSRTLEEYRSRFAESTDADERARLTREVMKRESRIMVLDDSLAVAKDSLHKISMEFLFNGVVIDPDKVIAQADREVVGAASNYAFSRMTPGDSLEMCIAEPEVKFDYSFMILPEGRFAQDNTIPSGLVYQIQIFLSSRPATVAQIKGLSPVFMERTSNGNYIYRVGVFRTYNDVLSNLNKVKKQGFKTAFIVAFSDGRQLSVQKARALEAKVKDTYQVRIVSTGDSLPELTLTAIRQVTDRDIAKVVEDGKVVFVVGPLEDEATASKLEAMVKISGVEDASVRKIGN